MKQLFTTIFFAISLTASGQYNWDHILKERYPDPKHRVDTTGGVLAIVASYEQWNGDTSYMVGCINAIKIDSITSYYGGIPCPNGRDGMYCEGWTDYTKSTTYLNEQNGIIDPKWIIKFIPK